jgi:hypothetical protein
MQAEAELFGLKPTGTEKYWYGARAIYKGPAKAIEFVWNRQQITGEVDEAIKESFVEWINSVGVPGLRKILADEWVTTKDDKEVRFTDHDAGYYIRANPRASGGYLYICAAPC